MSNVSFQEAESDLATLVDRAARGEVVTITRDGAPVAAIVPIESAGTTRAPRENRKPGLVELLMAFPAGDEVFERNRSPSRDVDF
ncbi:type II toxin-antitoxin system Phd/YefM family antitoxin [Jiella mangrovi]|uniref:Antitoxin n=1 Tax=Jiella mangrovi TaxID=2821407 RepID=A0ABS4BF96_9HYPH|nr:type II toxin-antitoxin system prevent-host-death family antitoxin [Jiella mangrovi]MBP0615438.1 type II toxin-antitoxin system prevent-host-death family antitoxin [Jiella mangrovi]